MSFTHHTSFKTLSQPESSCPLPQLTLVLSDAQTAAARTVPSIARRSFSLGAAIPVVLSVSWSPGSGAMTLALLMMDTITWLAVTEGLLWCRVLSASCLHLLLPVLWFSLCDRVFTTSTTAIHLLSITTKLPRSLLHRLRNLAAHQHVSQSHLVLPCESL